MWGETARGSRGPGTPFYPRAPRMRDTIDHHSRSAAGVSLSTSTRSGTSKSRYWVTTIRSPVVETTPPTRAPSGRVVRCRSSMSGGLADTGVASSSLLTPEPALRRTRS